MTPQHCAIIGGKLVLKWQDLHVALDGTTLRNNCRCAECRYITRTKGASAIDAANHSEAVTIIAASPMGYGLQLHFSDDHQRGLFPWSYLFNIGTTYLASKNGITL